MYLLYLLFLVDLKRKEFNKDALNQIKLLFFPDGCCTRFDLILCRFKSINESIFKLMMFIESGTLLKNYNSCNFPLKYYVKNVISTSCKSFNQPCLIWTIERSKRVLMRYFLIYPKYKISVYEKWSIRRTILQFTD